MVFLHPGYEATLQLRLFFAMPFCTYVFLMLPRRALKKHKYKMALQKINEAGEWPHNLGVGRPYDNLINTQLEDSLRILINRPEKNKSKPIDYEQYELKIKAITLNF